MPRKVTFGIIGCGMVLRIMFGPVLRFLERGQCRAVMDTNPDALRWAREHYEVGRTYGGLDDLLADPDIEAVLVGSPVFAHSEQVIAAANAGKHVFCEKPMAPTVRECRHMIQACADSRVLLMVGFMKRFNPCFLRAKQMIDAGELGEIFQVRTDWSWHQESRESWRDSLPTGGGLYQDHGSHVTDLCRWWVGEVADVSGDINILLDGREVEDQAAVVYRHTSGAISVHTQTRMTHQPLNEYYQVCGTKGTLEIQYGPGWSFRSVEPFVMTLHRDGITSVDVTPRRMTSVDEELQQYSQYHAELEHFCTCVREGREPQVTGADGLKAMEAITAVYLSSARRERVRLPLKEEVDPRELFPLLPRGIRVHRDGQRKEREGGESAWKA